MDTVDANTARLIWDVTQTIIMAIIAIYVWWTTRTRATTSAIQKVDERVTEVQSHVDRVESAVSNRPGHDDLEKLRNEVSSTNRHLAQVSAELQATTQLLGRLHEYLLSEKGQR
ncbi:DUF2730 family protein [Natronospirillum operosum]|uniref:DUF2730 family protein n=1 Tax=Natronospirillum operosum TaxID=2759953 RepID=A0A4Z0W906_9GAMM|nr:DUF2730 family protein [Natronospirillum operosum]TGG92518.1 DUF2730 family protein [Natronospirillum operosum]